MDLDSLPSQEEVMGWNPQILADFMRSLKLSGCDRVVMRGSITGAQFMQMTERGLQGFPNIYVPMITKIQSDINSCEQKQEQRKVFGQRLKASIFPKQALVQEEDVWNSDEFDNESDNDYEDPTQEEEEDNAEIDEDNYEMSSSTDTKQPQHQSTEKPHKDWDDTESVHYTSAARRPPHPPQRHKHSPQTGAGGPNVMHPPLPGMEHAPTTPLKVPAIPSVEKSKKPGPSKTDLSKLKSSNIISTGLSTHKLSFQGGSKPTDPSHIRSTTVSQAPAVPAAARTYANATPEPEKGLDPSWYGGTLTRQQAEVGLHQMNRDGAFMVRDSSQGSIEHPYTLMVLKDGRVYNIKIQNYGNSYSLGTNPQRGQSFPGVREMITHHTHTPLLLIDATDRSSGAQCQCCLLHPVGI